MNKKLIIVLILVAIGLIGGLALTAKQNRPQQPVEIIEPEATLDFANLPPNITVYQEMSTVAYTREELIDRSAVIFEGKVLSISPTFWNQDSGEYWYDDGVGLQLHTLEVEVLRPIVDTLGMQKQVIIYILGSSPLDGGAEGDGTTIHQGSGNYEMTVGDQVVFFAGQIELAWREGGTRKLLMSYPPLDTFVQRPDGTYYDPWDYGSISFEELLGEIAARRTTLVQP